MSENIIIHGEQLGEILREQVQDALKKQEIRTTEFIEFYLVNLLRDLNNPKYTSENAAEDIFQKPMALTLMEAMNADVPTRINKLKRLGDTALIVAGFFADSLRRTLVDLPYYISMGGAAYGHLASIYENQKMFSELYAELSHKFANFVDVLSTVAPWNKGVSSNTELVRVYERWVATGDDNLRELLENHGILQQ